LPALTPEYELVLMLDPELPDERRDQIAADARERIERAGSLKSDTAWGMRKLAYEIRQRTEADYRFYRFENGGTLLDELGHNLRIADGVLRFRIFKVDSRTPAIVPPPPTPLASGAGRGSRRDDRGRRSDGGRGRQQEEPAAAAPRRQSEGEQGPSEPGSETAPAGAEPSPA
jgi:small subunit ribosomal protein S6